MSTIKLSTKQVLFMKSTKRGIIFRAGIRSGKSRIACYKAILNALKGRRQLIVSFTYKNLKDVILDNLEKCLPLFGLDPNEYEINKGDMIVTVRGIHIYLRSGETPDKIRGIEVSDVFIDEAREFPTNEIFLVCIGRMSENVDGQWHITSTTKGKNWVWELENKNDGNIEIICQKTIENPFLIDGFVENLSKDYSTKFAKQELEGDIVELGAGIINPEWFISIDPIQVDKGVRYWDTAVSIKTAADFSAGALCTQTNNFNIANIIKGKFEYPELRKKIIETAQIDGINVTIGIEAVGQTKAFYDDLLREPALRRHTVRSITPRGDKFNRAQPWIARAEAGKVTICRGAWNADFKNECADFTQNDTHNHDDQIDAVSGAYELLNRPQGQMARINIY